MERPEHITEEDWMVIAGLMGLPPPSPPQAATQETISLDLTDEKTWPPLGPSSKVNKAYLEMGLVQLGFPESLAVQAPRRSSTRKGCLKWLLDRCISNNFCGIYAWPRGLSYPDCPSAAKLRRSQQQVGSREWADLHGHKWPLQGTALEETGVFELQCRGSCRSLSRWIAARRFIFVRSVLLPHHNGDSTSMKVGDLFLIRNIRKIISDFVFHGCIDTLEIAMTEKRVPRDDGGYDLLLNLQSQYSGSRLNHVVIGTTHNTVVRLMMTESGPEMGPELLLPWALRGVSPPRPRCSCGHTFCGIEWDEDGSSIGGGDWITVCGRVCNRALGTTLPPPEQRVPVCCRCLAGHPEPAHGRARVRRHLYSAGQLATVLKQRDQVAGSTTARRYDLHISRASSSPCCLCLSVRKQKMECIGKYNDANGPQSEPSVTCLRFFGHPYRVI